MLTSVVEEIVSDAWQRQRRNQLRLSRMLLGRPGREAIMARGRSGPQPVSRLWIRHVPARPILPVLRHQP